MKATILALTTAASLFGASEAFAGHRDSRWGVSFGFGNGGVSVHGFAGRGQGRHEHGRHVYAPAPCSPPVVVAPRHVHHRVPVYKQVWVPARYEQVFVGYDLRGCPVYQNRCVSYGHYETVVSCYRCECGHNW